MADDRGRATPTELEAALTGQMGAHQRFLVQEQLRHVEALDTQIQALDAEGATRELRESLPGVKTRVAETLLAAGGPTVEAFPSAAALAQGIGLAPGNHESAGQRVSGRTIPEPGPPRDSGGGGPRRAARTRPISGPSIAGGCAPRGSDGRPSSGRTPPRWTSGPSSPATPPTRIGGCTPWTGGTKTGRGHAVKRLEAPGYEVTLTPATQPTGGGRLRPEGPGGRQCGLGVVSRPVFRSRRGGREADAGRDRIAGPGEKPGSRMREWRTSGSEGGTGPRRPGRLTEGTGSKGPATANWCKGYRTEARISLPNIQRAVNVLNRHPERHGSPPRRLAPSGSCIPVNDPGGIAAPRQRGAARRRRRLLVSCPVPHRRLCPGTATAVTLP